MLIRDSHLQRTSTMTLNACICRGLLAAVLASAVPALAANLSFLNDAPFTHFTDEDHRIFSETLNNALDKGADGESRAWTNPKTKASGEIKPLKSFERNGVACRTAHIANKAKGRSSVMEYNFCRQPSGTWALAN
jgi:surface antigen